MTTKINRHEALGSYLAGLIEGRGTILVSDRKKDVKIIIEICKADLPLAEKLQKITQSGTIQDGQKGYCIWYIKDKEEVIKTINLINGYMRTPKINQLHQAILFFNSKFSMNIPLLLIDTTNLNSNTWLSGFTDSVGKFYINIPNFSKKKKGASYITRGIKVYFSIEIGFAKTFNKNVFTLYAGDATSYFNIMSLISLYLGGTVSCKTKEINNNIYQSFTFMAYNSESIYKTIEYFSEYPLFSSKYLYYLDWIKVVKIKELNNLTNDILYECEKLKSIFNSKRTFLSWKHLDNFYL